ITRQALEARAETDAKFMVKALYLKRSSNLLRNSATVRPHKHRRDQHRCQQTNVSRLRHVDPELGKRTGAVKLLVRTFKQRKIESINHEIGGQIAKCLRLLRRMPCQISIEVRPDDAPIHRIDEAILIQIGVEVPNDVDPEYLATSTMLADEK